MHVMIKGKQGQMKSDLISTKSDLISTKSDLISKSFVVNLEDIDAKETILVRLSYNEWLQVHQAAPYQERKALEFKMDQPRRFSMIKGLMIAYDKAGRKLGIPLIGFYPIAESDACYVALGLDGKRLVDTLMLQMVEHLEQYSENHKPRISEANPTSA